jgi:hypothetical protein
MNVRIYLKACIAKIYVQLGMSIGEHPSEDPRKIKLPSTFSLETFSADVENLLKSNKIYDSNVMLGKIEDEYHRNVYAILVEIFEGKVSKEEVKISLHYLLNQYPFAEYSKTMAAFVREVERQVRRRLLSLCYIILSCVDFVFVRIACCSYDGNC